ncbi:MAG: TetR/AcrR family transcriptional regulator [Brevinematia bacterium]
MDSKREKILRTAEALFAKKGYDATSVEEIANKAKVTKSLIYYYFKSKKDILKSMFKDFEFELLDVKKRAFKILFSTGSGYRYEEKLREILIQITFPFLEKWKNVIKIALVEEIKYFSKGPIFTYFDFNLKIASELYEKYNLKMELSDEQKTVDFFVIFLPIIGYSVFVDEWCAHYKFDRDRVKELIADKILLIYKEFFI